MFKLASLEISLDNSCLYVYDAVLDFDYLNHAAEHRLEQGFSGHPRSYKFFTLGECVNLQIEVWQIEGMYVPPWEITLRDDTIRAVVVPFSISPSQTGGGAKISHLMGMAELQVSVPSDEYALVFEIKLRNDPEYLDSSSYQEDVDAHRTQEYCYLTFCKAGRPVEPRVLRSDAWTAPPYAFNRYTPVDPTCPLVLDDEPTDLSLQ